MTEEHVIKVKKEHKEMLKEYSKRVSAIKIAIADLAVSSQQAHEGLWKIINNFYPETNDGGGWIYSSEKQTISKATDDKGWA